MDEVFSKPWSQRVNVLFYLRCACFVGGWRRRKAERNQRYKVLVEEREEEEEEEEREGEGEGKEFCVASLQPTVGEEDFGLGVVQTDRNAGDLNHRTSSL